VKVNTARRRRGRAEVQLHPFLALALVPTSVSSLIYKEYSLEYSSPSRMGERRGAYRALVGKPEGRNHLEDPGVDGRIILKLIFERLGVGAQTGLIWLSIRTGGGLLCIR
jgi:hypothetical protein